MITTFLTITWREVLSPLLTFRFSRQSVGSANPAKMAPNAMRVRLGILATKLHDRSQAAMRLLGLHPTRARGAMIPNPAIYPAKTAGFEAIRKGHLMDWPDPGTGIPTIIPTKCRNSGGTQAGYLSEHLVRLQQHHTA